MSNRKTQILNALEQFINKRPGLEPRDYIRDWKDTEGRRAYFAEARSITKDLHHARDLLGAVARRDSITADDLLKAAQGAFSGRLTITEENRAVKISYCVGQYFPTEYRKAVCSVLASAMWAYWREHCLPQPTYIHHGDANNLPMTTESRYSGLSAGDYLRKTARREFSRGIASRWFN
jgi:hypothetical protein